METMISRRGLWGAAFGIAASLSVQKTFAQTPQTLVGLLRSSGRYDDSMIFERKPFAWPGGKTLAVWIIPNVEIWAFDAVSDAAINPTATGAGPDVINYAAREYGMRVGLWRIADLLDNSGIRATVALNSAVCQAHPRVIEEINRRNWEFMAHGVTNTRSLSKLSIDAERAAIRSSVETIEKATGKKVRGWLGPGQIETANTPDLLAEEGLLYTADWNSDDQPLKMKVKAGEFYSLPHTLYANDVELFSKRGYSGKQIRQALSDQFDVLFEDSRKLPRVMGISLHPFLTGQPSQIGHLKEVVQYMKQRDGVWFATGTEIVEAYRKVA